MLQIVIINQPIKTEKKKYFIGTPMIGNETFINQFGVMGKNRNERRKKNKPSEFSSTY